MAAVDKAKEILESGVSVFLQVGHGSNFLTEFAHGLQLSRRTSMFFALLTVVTLDFLVRSHFGSRAFWRCGAAMTALFVSPCAGVAFVAL